MVDSETEKQSQTGADARIPRVMPSTQSTALPHQTSSAPAYTAAAYSFAESGSQPPNYIATAMPIVCCRAGYRPARVPATSNDRVSVKEEVQEEDRKWEQQHDYKRPPYEPSTITPERRCQRVGRWCVSNTSRRWLTAFAIIAGVLFLHRSFSGSESMEPLQASPQNCSNGLTKTFHFAQVENFSLEEKFQNEAHLNAKGVVRLEPAPEGQSDDIVVSVSYSASWLSRVVSPNWKQTDSSLRLEAPTLSTGIGSFLLPFGSRLRATASIYLKANITLQSLSIRTMALSVTSSPTLFTCDNPNPTIDTTTITTHAQPIHLPTWTSRKTILRTSSSPITGTFTLLDLLSLTSSSGSITATVHPGEADPQSPQPGLLKASTQSGSVDITTTSLSSIPDREYRSTISTSSASIKGTYLLGPETSLTTSSGSIRADFLSPPPASRPAGLHTSSNSGGTRAHILSDIQDEKALHGLRSEHESPGSGSVAVVYAAEWEGKITAESRGSGSVSVRGEGVVVDGKVGGRVEAHKGEEGRGSVVVRTGSGRGEVVVG